MDKVIIKNIRDFDIRHTLECGQCFHFSKIHDNDYGVVSGEKFVRVVQKDDELYFYNSSEKDVYDYWIKYFDLERDYSVIKEAIIKSDARLKRVIQNMHGVRILNQEFHETLISFIISQNKQIPHIKKIVFELSRCYGEKLAEIDGIEFYSFPDISRLSDISEEDFRELKVGFRAPYLRDAALNLYNEKVGDFLRDMTYEEAAGTLMQIKGVGEKVSNCVLLFSLGFRNAFPVDVWIKRIMEKMYFEENDTAKDVIARKAEDLFGEYGGYAQQYLFAYREIF